MRARPITLLFAGAITFGLVPPINSPAVAATGPALGAAGHPLALACGAEAWSPTPVPQSPRPGDLAAGPLIIPGAKQMAHGNPELFGQHGSYKVPFIVEMGETVTVTIEPPAADLVDIDNPYSPIGGVTSIIYHSCAHQPGFYAQSIVFLHGRSRGCVPLAVASGRSKLKLPLDFFVRHC
jgi:hypothetical protein